MVMEFFKGGSDKPLEEIESLIVQMLQDDRHTFDLAINALLGGTAAKVVGKEVRKSDKRVNRAEREVRRRLVVHAAVAGERVDLTRVLIAMSIVKDAERVGDHCKNIWDLADAGIDLSGADDLSWLMGMRDQTSRYVAESARIYQERDTEAAHVLIAEMDEAQDRFDECVMAQLESTESASGAVSRALLCRYLKRITSHLMNVLTSLVMPLERLDYYDEKKADRD
ncbi:MAG: PhoU domain-containing protein [Acidimicrobiia bacterium]|nr:PhoU domain-containing protein [Acidimicrobiia bacterium]